MAKLIKLLTERRVASRRKAFELIRNGHVEVNGEVVRDVSFFVKDGDRVKVKGKEIPPAPEKVYLLLNKPRGIVTSTKDNEGRKTVIELLPYRVRKLGVYPVGRLDIQTEGLVLLTNDGDFANYILNSGIEKRYLVKVKGMPDEKKIEFLRRGPKIGKIKLKPMKIRLLRKTKTNSWFDVKIKEGKKNQIRQMFSYVGHPVLKLKRIEIGEFKLKGIPLGGFIPAQMSVVEKYLKKLHRN